MKLILDFLRQLSENNNREWFAANKELYIKAQERFNEFTEQLIERVAQFDDSIVGLTAKDCTYRIYRDTRFSSDKTPYKNHMGCYICRGGKKSGYNGYYFHVAIAQGEQYPTGHMIAVGDYCMDPKALQTLREDISMGEGDFLHILNNDVDKSFRLDDSFKLKRPPKGYDESTPYIDLIKHKAFCLIYEPTTDEILSTSLLDNVSARFRSAKPFLDYINRAIEYSKEEG